jgi:hypothetical protein
MVDELQEGRILGIVSEKLVVSFDSDLSHFGDEINN